MKLHRGVIAAAATAESEGTAVPTPTPTASNPSVGSEAPLCNGPPGEQSLGGFGGSGAGRSGAGSNAPVVLDGSAARDSRDVLPASMPPAAPLSVDTELAAVANPGVAGSPRAAQQDSVLPDLDDEVDDDEEPQGDNVPIGDDGSEQPNDGGDASVNLSGTGKRPLGAYDLTCGVDDPVDKRARTG